MTSERAPTPSETITSLKRVIHGGSSSPVLAETEAGELFVVKLAGAGAGPRGLLTEFLGQGIARELGLAVPPARPLFLTADFPWQVGTDEFDDLIKRSAGWNLGIAYLPDAVTLGPTDLPALPPVFLSRLALADRLLQNVDRAAGNPNLIRSGGSILAIDFGSCLFLNRVAASAEPFRFGLPANHFLGGTNYAFAAPAEVDIGAVRCAIPALVEAAPPAWMDTLTFGPPELSKRLLAYADAFAQSEGK